MESLAGLKEGCQDDLELITVERPEATGGEE